MTLNAVVPNRDHELGDLIRDEQWCIDRLFTVRWPDGFICPFCGHRQAGQEPVRKILCRYCKKISTVTSGTILHGSKKQLTLWFQAIWWLISSVPDLSIKGLQKELEFSSYQTAWTWMGKLRLVLQIFVDEPSGGTVIVGPAEIPGHDGDDAFGRIITAVESIADGRMTGKVQMVHVDTMDYRAVSGFVRKHVRSGSSVIVPEREPFSALADTAGYFFIVDKTGMSGTVLPALMKAFAAWYKRKKYRPVNVHLVQGQLNEFCFMQTVRLYPNRRRLFERMLTALVEHGPVSVRELTGAADSRRSRI